MVGRLVEDEHVGGRHHKLGHGEASLLAAAQRLDGLIERLAAKAHAPEQVLEVVDGSVARGAGEGFEHGALEVERLRLVLLKVVGQELVALHLGRAARRLLAAHQEPEQRRLAGAVRAHQRYALAAEHRELSLFEERPIAVPMREALDGDHLLARARCLGEGERARLVLPRLFDQARLLHLLELLLGRLGAAALRAPLEPLDHLPLARNLLLLPLVSRHLLHVRRLLLAQVLAVIAFVGGRLAHVELDRLGGNLIQKLAVVAHHYHRLGALAGGSL
mmetsp:Transcript_30746/g.100058  ORF Transcript_30746/g.100058 Transcript_30746/m.100058 type:complete len:276 (-) Transcript_30746:1081-1908(-)